MKSRLFVLALALAGACFGCNSEPPATMPAKPPVKPSAQSVMETAAIIEVLKLGGRCERDSKNPDTPVTLISFANSNATDKDLAVLRSFKQLERLDLGGLPITNEGLKQLEGMESIKRLDLPATKVTDEGIVYLKSMTQLRQIDFWFCDISDAGMEQLKQFKQLQNLDVRRTKVTDKGAKSLQAELPLCRVTRL